MSCIVIVFSVKKDIKKPPRCEMLNIYECTWHELNNIYEYTWYELSKCVAVQLVRGFAHWCNDTCLIFIKGWLLFRFPFWRQIINNLF